jgi:hypothetical protein
MYVKQAAIFLEPKTVTVTLHMPKKCPERVKCRDATSPLAPLNYSNGRMFCNNFLAEVALSEYYEW